MWRPMNQDHKSLITSAVLDESTFLRMTLSKKLNQRTEVTYSTTVGHAAEGRVQVDYDLARYLFLEVERDALGESGADVKLRIKFR